MLCPKCGAPINDGAASCPSCGKAVATNQAAPAIVSVPNYMVPSILTTLFCCLFGGIIAIIFSFQVNSKLAQGDIAGAETASKRAKICILINIGLGLLMLLLSIFGSFSLIAVPNFIKYRNESQASACISNMKQLLTAGECWRVSHEGTPTVRDLCGPEQDKYIRRETELTCPKDGSRYSIRMLHGAIDVTCGSGDPEHVLPSY